MDSSNKRARPAASEDDLAGDSSAEMKRARRVSAEDYLFNILEDEDGGSESPGLDEGDDGLASVMHSLEQEIRSGAGGVVPEEEDGENNNNEVSVQQLGYLLEASDDELGLPPAAEESPSPAALARDVADLAAGADVAEAAAATMYGQMWGFDEEIGFGSDLVGFRPESADDGFLGLGFDDVGLFDHSEPSDLSWRTMPAV